MKTLYALAGLLIIFVISFVLVYGKILFLIDEEKEKYEIHLGEEYILNNDTLIIVDYSLLKETFTLSNKLEISYGALQKGKENKR